MHDWERESGRCDSVVNYRKHEMDPRGAEGRVNADTRAVVSGFLGAWTDPMGNNVQVKEVCNEVRV